MEYTLKHGSHRTREEGMCLLEAVAWIAGEPHRDDPVCACPVLAEYGRDVSDAMGKGPVGDSLRDKHLAEVAPMLVGTRSTPEVERRRACLLVDRSVRVIAPLALDATGLDDHAATLRALTPVTDASTARAAKHAAWADAAVNAAVCLACDACAAGDAEGAAFYAAYVARAAAYSTTRAAV